MCKTAHSSASSLRLLCKKYGALTSIPAAAIGSLLAAEGGWEAQSSLKQGIAALDLCYHEHRRRNQKPAWFLAHTHVTTLPHSGVGICLSVVFFWLLIAT